MKPSNPEDRLLLARDRSLLVGDDGSLRRRASRGELVRLNQGVYATLQDWRAWSADERYRARVFSVAHSRRGEPPVLFGYSAAAIWRLPVIGAWPDDVHVLADRAGGGRSHEGVRRHTRGFEHAGVHFHDGVRVTGIARTVLDLAATAPFMTAVAATDFALHTKLTTRKDLAELLLAMGTFRGCARAARVVEFARPLAESVAESAGRVTMARCGFPEPQLQKEFWGPNGEHAFVDYWFKSARRIGELDGRGKYQDPEFLRGRTSEQAYWDEKKREEWLRGQSDGFGRWDWMISVSPRLLAQRLLETGVHPVAAGHPDAFVVSRMPRA